MRTLNLAFICLLISVQFTAQQSSTDFWDALKLHSIMVQDEVDFNTAKLAPVLAECETEVESTSRLNQCFNDKFSTILANNLILNYTLPKGIDKIKVIADLQINKLGKVELVKIHETKGLTRDIRENIKNAVHRINIGLEKEIYSIQPAINQSNHSAHFSYSIPITFLRK